MRVRAAPAVALAVAFVFAVCYTGNKPSVSRKAQRGIRIRERACSRLATTPWVCWPAIAAETPLAAR